MRIVNIEPLIQRIQGDIEYEEQLLKELDNPTDQDAVWREICTDRACLDHLKNLSPVNIDIVNSFTWTNTKDGLPDDGETVLVVYHTPFRKMLVPANFHKVFDHIWWTWASPNYILDGCDLRKDWVTYWMPTLPFPDEESGGGDCNA